MQTALRFFLDTPDVNRSIPEKAVAQYHAK